MTKPAGLSVAESGFRSWSSRWTSPSSEPHASAPRQNFRSIWPTSSSAGVPADGRSSPSSCSR